MRVCTNNLYKSSFRLNIDIYHWPEGFRGPDFCPVRLRPQRGDRLQGVHAGHQHVGGGRPAREAPLGFQGSAVWNLIVRGHCQPSSDTATALLNIARLRPYSKLAGAAIVKTRPLKRFQL